MKVDGRKNKLKGFDNKLFKTEQALMVVNLINSGRGTDFVRKRLGITLQRVSQIYFGVTGNTITAYKQKKRLESLKIELPIIMKQTEKACKGCGVTFLAVSNRRTFHSTKCCRQYYIKYQTHQSWYRKRLKRKRIETAKKLLGIL